jgi:peptidoglycan/xylan/chitin deacetylase (PgdA/CDA1 family)
MTRILAVAVAAAATLACGGLLVSMTIATTPGATRTSTTVGVETTLGQVTSSPPAPSPYPAGTSSAAPVSTTTAAPTAAPTAAQTRAPTKAPTKAPTARAATPKPTSAKCSPTGAAVPAASFGVCVPILEYHRIAPASEIGTALPALVVSPAAFAAQMDELEAAGWHTITLGKLGDDLLAGRTPPAKSFVVTIDDGWYDGYDDAFPILKAHGFVATFFVISGRIDHPSFLSSSNLTSLTAAGDEIGNHTVDHVKLGSLTGAALSTEIDGASDRIAQVTGVRPKSFAYPMGVYNSTVVAAAAACPGMEIAVTEHKGIEETTGGRFTAPRLKITPEISPAQLLSMMAG